jgi:hypothetical protein
MRGSRTPSTLILAGALGFGTLVGLASPAFAETPAHDGNEMVLVMGGGDTDPQGPGDIAPAPTPDPDGEIAPAPTPDPEPQPQPGPGEIVQPTGHGDPEPGDDLPLGTPGQDPDGPDGPGDLADDPGCTFTHGCEGDEPTPDGHCFDEGGNVVDVSECMPTDEPGDQPQGDQPQADDDSSTEVLGSTTGRTALPHTGAGLALLSAAGLGLVAAGTVARKVARR